MKNAFIGIVLMLSAFGGVLHATTMWEQANENSLAYQNLMLGMFSSSYFTGDHPTATITDIGLVLQPAVPTVPNMMYTQSNVVNQRLSQLQASMKTCKRELETLRDSSKSYWLSATILYAEGINAYDQGNYTLAAQKFYNATSALNACYLSIHQYQFYSDEYAGYYLSWIALVGNNLH